MDRLAILAGAGFIGSRLVQRIDPSTEVIVVDQRPLPGGSHATLRPSSHLAEAVKAASHIVDLTVEGAGVKAIAELGTAGQHLIFASSSAVYGAQPEGMSIAEDSPLLAANAYGRAKIEVERELERAKRDRGVVPTALRIFNVYGEAQNTSGRMASVVARFTHAITASATVNLTAGGQHVRDFVHVDDVAEAIWQTLASPNPPDVANVGSGVPTRMIDLLRGLEVRLSARACTFDAPEAEGEIRWSVADISRLRSRTGFEPTITLDDGLDRVARAATA